MRLADCGTHPLPVLPAPKISAWTDTGLHRGLMRGLILTLLTPSARARSAADP